MKHETVIALTDTFEAHAQATDGGVEFWLARDLQHLLGYADWRNFVAVVHKAKTACEVSGHAILDHFVDVTKMVDLGSGSQREIDDVKKVERRLASEEGSSSESAGGFSSLSIAKVDFLRHFRANESGCGSLTISAALNEKFICPEMPEKIHGCHASRPESTHRFR